MGQAERGSDSNYGPRRGDFVVYSWDLEGFGAWSALDFENRSSVVGVLPLKPGVYAMRFERSFGRFIGESDIVYIGSATGSNGLKGRISQYFDADHTQETNIRIRNLVGDSSSFSVSYRVAANEADALAREAKLLQDYFDAHGELPPANRSLPRRQP